MSALRERLCVLGELAPDDAAMPLGMAVVFAGLLVLEAGLSRKRKHCEAGVIGGSGDGVVPQKSDERYPRASGWRLRFACGLRLSGSWPPI